MREVAGLQVHGLYVWRFGWGVFWYRFDGLGCRDDIHISRAFRPIGLFVNDHAVAFLSSSRFGDLCEGTIQLITMAGSELFGTRFDY